MTSAWTRSRIENLRRHRLLHPRSYRRTTLSGLFGERFKTRSELRSAMTFASGMQRRHASLTPNCAFAFIDDARQGCPWRGWTVYWAVRWDQDHSEEDADEAALDIFGVQIRYDQRDGPGRVCRQGGSYE